MPGKIRWISAKESGIVSALLILMLSSLCERLLCFFRRRTWWESLILRRSLVVRGLWTSHSSPERTRRFRWLVRTSSTQPLHNSRCVRNSKWQTFPQKNCRFLFCPETLGNFFLSLSNFSLHFSILGKFCTPYRWSFFFINASSKLSPHY